MTSVRLLLPVARIYAEHVGRPLPDAELRRRLQQRLAAWPRDARAAAGAGAWLLRWVLPALWLGRPRRFDGLDAAAREHLLERFLRARLLVLRGPGLALSLALVAACSPRPAEPTAP